MFALWSPSLLPCRLHPPGPPACSPEPGGPWDRPRGWQHKLCFLAGVSPQARVLPSVSLKELSVLPPAHGPELPTANLTTPLASVSRVLHENFLIGHDASGKGRRSTCCLRLRIFRRMTWFPASFSLVSSFFFFCCCCFLLFWGER